MKLVTVGERYQVVIPKDIRTQLDIEPHSKVHVSIQGDSVVFTPSRTGVLRGAGSELRERAAQDYVAQLRREWDTRP